MGKKVFSQNLLGIKFITHQRRCLFVLIRHQLISISRMYAGNKIFDTGCLALLSMHIHIVHVSIYY